MKPRRLIASLLSLCMVATASSTALFGVAFAAEAINQTSAKLVVSSDVSTSNISLVGKRFNAYQVFDATLMEFTTEEQGIEYTVADGFAGFFEDVLTVERTHDDFDHDAIEYVEKFKDPANGLGNMQDLVALLRAYALNTANGVPVAATTDPVVTTSGKTESVSTTENLLGYYLVLDAATNVAGTGDVVTAGALVTVPSRDGLALSANTTIHLKGSMPDLEKDVYHNDTKEWTNISDYQIGDTIEYRIIADIPSNVTGYAPVDYSEITQAQFNYTYEITDTPSAGVDLDRSNIKIYTDEAKENEVEGLLHYQNDNADGGFTLVFDMVSIANKFQDIDKFYIYYTGELTNDAEITLNAEENTAKLEYSNNPYDSTSTGTVEDTVYTYTFDLDVTKTSGDGETLLPGAMFALYQTHVDGKDDNTKQIYLTDLGNNRYAVTPNPTNKPSDNLDTPAGVITTADAPFTIIGLDDVVKYELREIKAPTNYNAADPIFFTITATYKEEYGIPKLDELTTSSSSISHKNNDLATTIINTSSKLLPSTGGMGTTLFTYGGIFLMVSAGMFLVIKRKKS